MVSPYHLRYQWVDAQITLTVAENRQLNYICSICSKNILNSFLWNSSIQTTYVVMSLPRSYNNILNSTATVNKVFSDVFNLDGDWLPCCHNHYTISVEGKTVFKPGLTVRARYSQILSAWFHSWFPSPHYQWSVSFTLGVIESCRTRIPGWSNRRVDFADTVAIICTLEYLHVLVTSLRELLKGLGAPRRIADMPENTEWKSVYTRESWWPVWTHRWPGSECQQ